MAQEDLSASFHSSTETLSNQVRYVNYSLIAVVWLLGGNAVSGLMTNGNGLILLFILLSLFLDLCQYIWSSVTIWYFMRKNKFSAPVAASLSAESNTAASTSSIPMLIPAYIPKGTWVFYIAKLAACLIACVMLVVRLIRF